MTNKEAIYKLIIFRRILERGVFPVGHRFDAEPFDLAISALEKQDRWNPCSEGLPKAPGEYIVTYHPCYWGEVRPELKVGFDSFRGKTTWAKNKYQKVVAWKEKPEPYLGDVE